MKVWLDDERRAPDGWVHVESPRGVIHLIQTEDVTDVSLDHDLGDLACDSTGYDVLVWLEAEVAAGRMTSVPRIFIHTANPVAKDRMMAARAAIGRLLRPALAPASRSGV